MPSDRIETSVTVNAAIERVWRAITTPSELAQWFGDVAEFDLVPGSSGKVGWTEFAATAELVIETVEPPTRFSFRWSAVSNEPFDPSLATHVEFALEDLGDATRVVVNETGFATLPEELGARQHEENTAGWKHELADLAAHVEDRAA